MSVFWLLLAMFNGGCIGYAIEHHMTNWSNGVGAAAMLYCVLMAARKQGTE